MLHEFSFPSYNERDQVQSWIYVPAAKPKGIVQVIHGFGEHSRRYLHMICKFLDAGYIVAADDHVGHGKTAVVSGVWSDWGKKGPHTMMEDEHRLHDLVCEKYPGLPYFLFGHSMGSFIVRDYLTAYGEDLSGATICGTAGSFPNLDKAAALLREAVAAGKGTESDPSMGAALMGWLCDRCGTITIGNEWICADPFVQRDHAEDPFDAFTRPASNRSLLDFTEMIRCITGPDWAARVPKALPLYVISGDQDPVGLYGEGVYQVVNWLCAAGRRVTTKMYCGYRHEIHNYPQIKDEVENGIVAFMDNVLS